MELLNATTTCQTGHHQVRAAANSNDVACTATGTVVGRPVAARSSALAVPDDPLDSIVQCLGAEDNGFAVDTGGGWFDEFFNGGMDMSMSACAGGEEFMEMLMDLPVPDTTETVLASEATETATFTRDEAAAVPDRPAVPKPSPLSVSSSDGMDEDDDHWVSSSDSSSDDDAADAHWLPTKSKKRSGTKRRLQQQQQQSTPAGQRKQRAESVVLPAPHGMVVAAKGGGGGVDRWCRHCGTVETPLWRAGPDGAKTLCNACGLRYKNKTAAPTTMRRPTAKPGRGEGKNQTVLRSVGDTTVVRKKRSIAMRVD